MSNSIATKLKNAQVELETCTDPNRTEELEALIEHYASQLKPSPHGVIPSIKRALKEMASFGGMPEENEEDGEDV